MITTLQKDWIKDTFDEKYLDTYIDLLTPEKTKQEVDFLVSLFKKYGMHRILDVACGYGRHSIPLAEQGYDVVGIDQSQYFIEKAMTDMTDEVIFSVGDMRDLTAFSKFDAAINMFTSFGYLDDTENEKVLTNINLALEIGGIFVLDLANPHNFKNTINTSVLSNGLTVHTEIETDGKSVTMQRLWDDKSYTAYFRLYGLPEITGMLTNAGFKVVETFGSFDGSALDEQKSPRYILVSRKL